MEFKEYIKKFNKYEDSEDKEIYIGEIYIERKGISSFQGMPKEIHGNLIFRDNILNSLQYSPTKVIGNFYVGINNLTSLKYSPSQTDDFSCYKNQLTSLEGSPGIINGSFFCEENNLTSLIGCTKKIKTNFNCSYNKLNTLEGDQKKLVGTLIVVIIN